MRQYLVPALLLATVALSSSNVLPISVEDCRKPLDLDRQYNDNIFSNRYQTRNVLEDIYKMYIEEKNRPGLLSKLQQKYADADNNENEDMFNIINKDDNYNGEGFRKEQWHNYPRQLDRLHQFLEHDSEKRNYEPDPDIALTREYAPDTQENNEMTNEFLVDTNTDTSNIYDAVIAANPLLIFKIRLACMHKEFDNTNKPYDNRISTGLGANNIREDEKIEPFRNDNPEVINVLKVKREGVPSIQSNELTDTAGAQSKVVNKRIFSLWSRLQSLNHKGHELQHRRHLHAFYGLPDSDGGGTLTAETRATLMRPPGSPLRWG